MNVNVVIANIKTIDAQMEDLKVMRRFYTDALIKESKGQTGKVVVPTGSYTISENNTYSEPLMLAALKPGQIRRVSKSVLDKPAVKRLYPEVYSLAKIPNGFKVTVG